jgi:general secretion pathway protein I
MNYLARQRKGFTLIEVLIALAIISISLTAILKSNAASIATAERLYDKTVGHWVAVQAMNMIDLHLLTINPSEDKTNVTSLLGQKWYWRAHLSDSPIKDTQKLSILISKKQTGPFVEALSTLRVTE